MNDFVAKLSVGGRVGIPSHMRKELGITEGSELVLRLVGKEIHMLSREGAIRRAKEIAQKYKSKKSMVEELIAERRAAALNE